MGKLFNLARMSTATSGTGTITLGVAVSGYLTFAQAGVTDQDIVSYAIKDGSNSENGTGLYTSSGTTLTRNVAKSTNSNAAINLSGTAEVFITPRAEDLQSAIAGYIFGLTLSTAGSSATFSVAAGRAADSTAVDMMVLASAISKTTSAWAVGSGNGGLDTGAIANNTWYHAHLIKRADTGVVDALVSLSGSAPTLPTGYTWSRRIGSMLTDGSAHWILFTQSGDEFLWSVPVADVNALAVGATGTHALSVAPGFKVNALIVLYYVNTASSGAYGIIYSGDGASQGVNSPTGNINVGITQSASLGVGASYNIRTDTNRQIRSAWVTAANNSLFIITIGWVDRRGRDA